MTDYMQETKDGGMHVPFSDDDAEKKGAAAADLDDEDTPGASPEQQLTRRQKRQARLQGLIKSGEEAQARVKELEERDQKRERELAELRGMVAATREQIQHRQETPGKDPFEAQLDAVYERQRNAYNAAQAEIKAGTFNEERQRYYEKEAREIEASKSRIHAQQVLAHQEPVRRAEQAGQRWVNTYPDVYRNPNAYQYAEATYKRRRALGEADSEELVHDVMRDAMTQFKLGPKPAPTANERAKFTGMPSSGGGGAGRGDATGITMTPELRRMATAAYSDLPEAEAIKKWANTTGKRMRERKIL